MISSWWKIKDLEGLKKDALLNRQLGFRGQGVIHPSHVPIVDKIFTPSIEEIAHCQGIIKASEEAEMKGSSVAVYRGNMVDRAMVKTAIEMLEFANSIGIRDQTVNM
jgi:citrate lyase subunit beta/citryl-CoA lyase